MEKPFVLILCVNYNNDADTILYIKDILTQKENESFHIVIVNNDDLRKTKSKLLNALPIDERIFLFEPGKNMGYFGGASWGLKKYLKDYPLPEWVIVSNTDLRIYESDFFKKLIEYGKEHNHDVIAPDISTPKGKSQNVYMKIRPTNRRMKFYKWTFRFYLTLQVYELLSKLKETLRFGSVKFKEERIDPSERVLTQIYAPHGSFIAFRKKYFEAGGNLDYGVFLFNEEIFVAETARRLGLTVAYDSRLKVEHNEHKTTGFPRTRKMARHMKDASVYCAETFFNEKGCK